LICFSDAIIVVIVEAPTTEGDARSMKKKTARPEADSSRLVVAVRKRESSVNVALATVATTNVHHPTNGGNVVVGGKVFEDMCGILIRKVTCHDLLQ
jgi:hypothetical protein